MTQAEDARRAYEHIHRSVRSVDDLLRSAAETLTQQLGLVGIAVVSRENVSVLRAIVAEVLASIFGGTSAEVSSARLAALIRAETLATGAAHYRQAWDELDTYMRRRDPVTWSKVVRHLRSAPLDERDGLMRAYRLLYGPQVDRERLARSLFLDPQRRWVDPSGYRLDDRIWRDGRAIRRAIDERIALAVRNGESVLDVARDIERYLNPDHAPVRYLKNGRILRNLSPAGSVTAMPGRGHGSTYARRLVRTEISRINGVAAIYSAMDVPGILGIRWRLSGRHPEPDACDDNATRDAFGLGPGVYPIDQVPPFPNHPQDLCVLVHVHKSWEQTRMEIVQKYRDVALGAAA